jgi:hypothetical protein
VIVAAWLTACWIFVALVMLALCRAAADGDILATRALDDDPVVDVGDIEERRSRRERLDAWAVSVTDQEPVA